MKNDFYFVTKFEFDQFVYHAIKQEDDTYIISWHEEEMCDSAKYKVNDVKDALEAGVWTVSDENGVIQ